MVGIIPLIIFVNTVLGAVENYYKTIKINNLKYQANALTADLKVLPDIEKVKSENLNEQIDQLAKNLSGRILVIRKEDYKIIKDTNEILDGIKFVPDNPIVKDFFEEKSQDSNPIIKLKKEKMLQCVTKIDVELNNNVNNKVDNKVQNKVVGFVIIYSSTKDIIDAVNSIRSKAVLIFLIFLIIILTITYYYSDLITRPFKTLLHFINEIALGHFDGNIKVKGNLEIEKIADAFNYMTKQLQAIDQSRKEFVSNVSHELKTPLTSMKVLADSLLSQENIPNELYKEFLEDINAEIERENKIINDLLSLVKMDKKEAVLNIEKISINNLIEEILKRLKPIASIRNIELIYESYREVVAEVDEVKFSLAVNNLIENAIKYNLDDGWVKITLDADHKYFYFKVTDSGVGIPQDEQDRIFERFYRVDKARSRDTGGTGLGLAITKHAVLIHKGYIKVKSTMGKGTSFSVKIPLYYNL